MKQPQSRSPSRTHFFNSTNVCVANEGFTRRTGTRVRTGSQRSSYLVPGPGTTIVRIVASCNLGKFTAAVNTGEAIQQLSWSVVLRNNRGWFIFPPSIHSADKERAEEQEEAVRSDRLFLTMVATTSSNMDDVRMLFSLWIVDGLSW